MKSFVLKKIISTIFFILFLLWPIISLNINSKKEETKMNLEANNDNNIKPDPQLKPNFINSSILINGVKYQAICDCENKSNRNQSNAFELSDRLSQTGTCDLSKMNFSTEITGNGASIEAVKSLFGNPQDIAFVKLEDYSFTCIDGRNKSVGISTPGGDAGEFLLALDVYENLLSNKKNLDYNSVEILLKSYLRFMKQSKFKMCTDNKALDFIKNEMMIEGVNINNPRPQIKDEILRYLLMPESIGDLHLKLVSKYPGKFMIRKELVDHFFKAFYNLLWDKNNDSNQKLELVILNDDHMESAFVEVRMSKECLESKVAPLFANWDRKTNTSIFINHIDSISIRRKQMSDFFSEKINHSLDEVDGKKMLERLKHHGNAFLDLFGSIAARGLPFYTISIS